MDNENNNINRQVVDVCKIFCALLIVSIHIRPFTSFSEVLDFYVVDIIARLAVPFFYAATSFFFFKKLSFSKEGKLVKCYENNLKLIKYIKRIFLLYSIWSAIYLLWQIPYWNSIGWKGISAVVDYVIAFFLRGSVYHFWYFVSLIYGVIILYKLLQILGMRKTFYLAIGLYLVKCLVYGYSWINMSLFITIEKVWNLFSGLCDGMCLALPFMMIGVLASQKNTIYPKIYRYRKLGLAASIIGLVAEVTLLFERINDGRYSYVAFTFPVCVFFFTNVFESAIQVKEKYCIFELRKCSTVIFCIHPFVIYLCQLNETFDSLTSLIKYIIVTIISIIIAIIVVGLRKKFNLKFLTYLM